MRIVLDTNVVVSALLTEGGFPAEVLHLVLTGEVEVAADERILQEYRQVLAGPRFAHLPRAGVRDTLQGLTEVAVMVAPRRSADAVPHAGDAKFVEVALAARSDALVTGNVRHYPPEACPGVLVRTPRQFVALMARRGR